MLYNAGQCFTDSRNLHSPHETHSHQKGFFGFGDSRNPLLQMGLMDGAVAERLDSRVGNLTARVDACNSPPLLAPAFFTAPFRRHRHRILFPTTRPPHVRWVTCPYVSLFPVLHEMGNHIRRKLQSSLGFPSIQQGSFCPTVEIHMQYKSSF